MEVKSASIITYLCIFVALLLFVLLHFMRSDLDPINHYLSEYGVGKYNSIFIMAMLTVVLGSSSFLYSLIQTMMPTSWSRSVILFFGLWILGIFLTTIFPTDLPNEIETFGGLVHDISSTVAFFALVLGLIALRLQANLDTFWIEDQMKLNILLILNTILLILYYITPEELVGLFQRILVTSFAISILIINSKLFLNY